MKKIIFIVLMISLCLSCTNSDGAKKFLESQGYTEITITGFDLFAHGKEDWPTTGFTAISPNGKKVKGAVSDKGIFNFFKPRMNLRIW